MRNFLLATVALAGLSFQATAADLPVRAPAPAPAPIFMPMNWTGFYLGAQIGYSWGDDSTAEFFAGVPTGFNRNFSSNGITGGLHAGYNYQTGAFVLGVEGDIEATAIDGGYRILGDGTDTKTGWQGSLRLRLGYAFGNSLLYATGGLAFADLEHIYINGLGPVSESFSKTRTGWTLGAGYAYAFTRNWSARIEYRYTDYGNFQSTSAFAFPGFTYRQEPTSSSVRIGVSYLFAGPTAPVLARY